MNSFNYFALLGKKQSGQSMDLAFCLRIGIVLVAACALLYGVVSFRSVQRRQQLQYLQTLKNDPALNARYEASLSMAELADRTKSEVDFLELLQQYAVEENVVTFDLVNLLNGCMLRGSAITRIALTSGEVTLEGDATNLNMVRAIEENLRASGRFDSVMVESVTAEETGGKAHFTSRLVLKGGEQTHE